VNTSDNESKTQSERQRAIAGDRSTVV